MDAQNIVIPGGRSFFLALLTLLIVSCFMAYSTITEGAYTTIVLGTVGAYIARAIAEDRMAKKNDSSLLPNGIKP